MGEQVKSSGRESNRNRYKTDRIVDRLTYRQMDEWMIQQREILNKVQHPQTGTRGQKFIA